MTDGWMSIQSKGSKSLALVLAQVHIVKETSEKEKTLIALSTVVGMQAFFEWVSINLRSCMDRRFGIESPRDCMCFWSRKIVHLSCR